MWYLDIGKWIGSMDGRGELEGWTPDTFYLISYFMFSYWLHQGGAKESKKRKRLLKNIYHKCTRNDNVFTRGKRSVIM